MNAISIAPDHVDTQIDYLLPTSRINRRFWAPGAEYNTGVYQPYPVRIHNARRAGHEFTLDTHGFTIARHTTAITDWAANYGPDSAYAREVEAAAMALTGADHAVTMGGMQRSSRSAGGNVQPPAAEAHVDFTTRCSQRIAEALYRRSRPEGRGYERFIIFSLWRVLTPPPQDMPLALCDFRSVRDDEGTHNTKVDVDVIPTGDALFAPIPGEENMAEATIFHHSPDHQWWYYPDMALDEIIFIKFHDSDHGRAWRAPHTAFRDSSRPDAVERRSMEFRGIAYFTRD